MIANSPNICHYVYGSDYTKGKLLIINSAPVSKNFWCQSVNVSPNKTYTLGFSLRSAVTIDNQPNRIQWTVNGVAITPQIQTQPVFTDYTHTWNSNNSSTALIC